MLKQCALLFVPVLINAQEVSITVYHQDRALVRDVRELTMEKGVSTVSFTDVASRIDPTSVHFKSLTAPDDVRILEQNYEYDLVGGSGILAKYVDEDIRLITKKGELFQGNLLSVSDHVVLRNPDGRIVIMRSDEIQHFDLPRLPDGLITRPTLVWRVNNRGPQRQKSEISYLTHGMNWHAEYVGIVNVDDTGMDLSGWVSVDNRSGASFKDAKLKLVAGDVNVIHTHRRLAKTGEAMMLMADAVEAPQFEEKSFFEYHLYTLQRPATLKQNQTKQVSLFSSTRVRTEKRFVFDGHRYADQVRIYLDFENRKKEGLGLPLPKGKVRIYKSDTDGALEFIGEDKIDHTPVDAELALLLGNAFDLRGKRTVIDSEHIGQRSKRDRIEILLKNQKNQHVRIVVVERFYQNWTIEEKSHSYKKKDANTVEFDVEVPKKGDVTMVYTVLNTW